MLTVVRVICACYSLLLVLYPRGLRDSYGKEMVEVLRQQLLDSFEAAGMWGDLRTAGSAMGELVTIGIPSRLKNEMFAVFALAICTSFAMLYALSLILHDPDVLKSLMRRLGVHCP